MGFNPPHWPDISGMTEIVLHVHGKYDLDATLDCGQTFRWIKKEGFWRGVTDAGVCDVRQKGARLFFEVTPAPGFTENAAKAYLKKYFNTAVDLDEAFSAIIGKSGKYRGLFRRIIDRSSGLVLLRQELLETMTAFLFSQQSAIPLISKRIARLCALFPENGIMHKGEKQYLFPKPEDLKSLSGKQIKGLNLGFRERYFMDLIRNADDAMLDKIRSAGRAGAGEMLKSFSGIGDKIAECVCLFSLSHGEAFPADVWIKRFYARYLSSEDPGKFSRRFGKYAGLLQEYIYRFIRNEKN